jgi:alkanesulfonate monooxygenase SsuD/methylene tetrahydromethanopterin reductase-like flavin-dependent oxidoreductase (luciferase family)
MRLVLATVCIVATAEDRALPHVVAGHYDRTWELLELWRRSVDVFNLDVQLDGRAPLLEPKQDPEPQPPASSGSTPRLAH